MENNQYIEKIKSSLRDRVEEWLGFDIPEEGTEDYATWMSKVDEVEDIVSIRDLVDYLESERIEFSEFVINGQYDLVAAGMEPKDIPRSVIEGLGEEVDLARKNAPIEYRVYNYGGKYFVLSVNHQQEPSMIFDNANIALGSLGIVVPIPETKELVYPPNLKSDWFTELQEFRSVVSRSIESRAKSTKYIIVTGWPDGTMAFKFGGALTGSLYIDKTEMKLVQLSPERIFRVTSAVNEQEFRNTLSKYDVSFPGKILFIEI
jgi:hypothetical protein